jgi:hypothetical protein
MAIPKNDSFDQARFRLQEAFFDPSNTKWNTDHVIPESQRQVESGAQTFQNLFRQLVGRDADETETNSFYENVAGNARQYGQTFSQGSTSDYVKDFVASNFQRTAEDQALSELQKQQQQATSLADLYRNQGRQAISGVEGRLQDYQSRLFEKLRPQLITSLQSQGLLNTGGLNEAFAGAAKDLAADTSNYLTDQYLQNEQGANAIAFGGASAPYEYAKQQALGRTGQLQAQGESAIQRAFQQRVMDQQFNNQMNLMNRQATIQNSMQPSFLRTMSQNFATSLGQNLGKWGSPETGEKAAKMYAGGM